MAEGSGTLRIRDDGIWFGEDRLDLNDREISLLTALSSRRVLSRMQLARAAGLVGQSERRCDSILVGLRRHLPADAIRNVRARGWMLNVDVIDERVGESAG